MIFSGSERGLWEGVRIPAVQAIPGWGVAGALLQFPRPLCHAPQPWRAEKTSMVSRPGNPRAIAGWLRPALVEAIDHRAGFRPKTKP